MSSLARFEQIAYC